MRLWSPWGQLNCSPSLLSCHLWSLKEPWGMGATLRRSRGLGAGEPPKRTRAKPASSSGKSSVCAYLSCQGHVETSDGGQPQQSLPLTALVQLVKEIPEFLFGEVKGTADSPESGGASLDGERASPEAAVTVETCPLRGLPSYLPEIPVRRPSLATTPTGSSSSSSLTGEGEQGSLFPTRTRTQKALPSSATCAADTSVSAGKESPEAPGNEPSTPTCSSNRRKSHRKQERGARGAGVSPGSSPLQGLINCLREILVPEAQHPEVSPPLSGLSRSRPLGPGGPPWEVKTEAASGACPLEGLLKCLKEIPEASGGHPSPSGARELQQEEPGAWNRTTGGPRPSQTPPPCPEPGAAGVLPVVKTEASWTQSPQGCTPYPTVPAFWQLSKRTPSFSAPSSLGGHGDTRGLEVPSWGPVAQASSASSSPLEALEACLKGIPLKASLPPQPLTTSWSRSLQQGEPGFPRPEPQPHRAHGEEGAMAPLPLGLQGCGRDSPARPPGLRCTPTSFSSSSSSDGDLDFRSPEGSQGHQPGKGSPFGSSPLQGLENCLKEIPGPRPQPAWSWSLAADGGLRRGEPRNWTVDKEGLSGESCEPYYLRPAEREVPTRSLLLASPPAFTSGIIPACPQQGLKDHGATRPGSRRWLQEGATTRPSPLHCLENSLKGILPVRPLRFTCLASPSPSPSSSLSSSEGEDQRLEPEPWQSRLLQESGRLSSCKGHVPLSPHPGVAPTSSSGSGPGDDQRTADPGDCRDLSTAGKAEEKTGDCSQPPWGDVCTETAGRPGPLSRARGGATVNPCPIPQLEKKPRPGACQPPGSALGPLSWTPRVSDKCRNLEPAEGRPHAAAASVAVGSPSSRHQEPCADLQARTDGRLLPRGLPVSPTKSPRLDPPLLAPTSPALPVVPPQPLCPCGSSLQQELHSLSAALSETLGRLAAALAGLSQEVATMKSQVDRPGRRARGLALQGQPPRPQAFPRGPHWVRGPLHRHLPYWRQKGPTRPKPKVLRGPGEGCRAGDPSGLSRGKHRLAPLPPPAAPPAEAAAASAVPSGPNSCPAQQPAPSAPSCRAMMTVQPPLGHTGRHLSPLPSLVPAALSPQIASPKTCAEAEPPPPGAVPHGILTWPKDSNSLLTGVQRVPQEEMWGSERRDSRWGAHDRVLHRLRPAEEASSGLDSPLAPSSGCLS
ncbi:protein KRBA1 isoform X5 [Dasypus novemcinctus]|uniref:protein KRBA1 isoform X5 n=1 Tax=Dasypus novemcinctus TaxID=9361 RepID=UPI0003290DD7|nr:protein KRBA1 isoform X5 [Dasypus novemcinctus]